MACAIIDSTHANKPVLIEYVSGLFAKLRQEHIVEVGKVALRRLPHGLYSEDVEAFFGRLLTAGFATSYSPLKVNPEGVQLCQELVADADPEALDKVVRVLGFDLSLIKSPVAQPKPA
jgi:hypothetical protein